MTAGGWCAIYFNFRSILDSVLSSQIAKVPWFCIVVSDPFVIFISGIVGFSLGPRGNTHNYVFLFSFEVLLSVKKLVPRYVTVVII